MDSGRKTTFLGEILALMMLAEEQFLLGGKWKRE
jgi:hypothetical protein